MNLRNIQAHEDRRKYGVNLLNRVLRAGLMYPNKKWNLMGPPVPKWFEKSIRSFDPQLTLQFIPPASDKNPDGASAGLFPNGVWAICRRLRRSKMLLKKWTWHLADEHGNYSPPGGDTVRVLRQAFKFHRQGMSTKMEEMMDRHIADLHGRRRAATKHELSNKLYSMIVRNNLFSNIEGRTRVMFRDVPWKVA